MTNDEIKRDRDIAMQMLDAIVACEVGPCGVLIDRYYIDRIREFINRPRPFALEKNYMTYERNMVILEKLNLDDDIHDDIIKKYKLPPDINNSDSY